MTYEGLRLRMNSCLSRLLADGRGSKIRNKNFTIISNNCWGGMVYESLNIQKQSPTVGMYIMADDYIRFCTDLEQYISEDLTFINAEESKHKVELMKDSRFGRYPVGKLKDIEIMFLHYHSEEDAFEKWTRRCKRVDFDRMIVKCNDQNGCHEDNVRAFSELDFEHRLFFTIRDWNIKKWDGFYIIKQNTKDSCITASHEPILNNRDINIIDYINSI